MEKTVTIPLKEYENLKKYEDAVKNRYSLRVGDYSRIYLHDIDLTKANKHEEVYYLVQMIEKLRKEVIGLTAQKFAKRNVLQFWK